jgi:hypothetical protein
MDNIRNGWIGKGPVEDCLDDAECKAIHEEVKAREVKRLEWLHRRISNLPSSIEGAIKSVKAATYPYDTGLDAVLAAYIESVVLELRDKKAKDHVDVPFSECKLATTSDYWYKRDGNQKGAGHAGDQVGMPEGNREEACNEH